MKLMWLKAVTLLIALSSSVSSLADHGLSFLDKPKYPKEFSHYDYVNPAAPKGGILKLGVQGTFHSTNPFTLKDAAPAAVRLLTFESLLKRADDEPLSAYGLISQDSEVAPDRSWVIFTLRPEAKWHDGEPITAHDVAFTYELLREKGPAALRMYAKKIERLEIINDHKIKIVFLKQENGQFDEEMPIITGFMPVLPKHYLKDKDFEKLGMTPILGSGAYRISKVDAGRSLTFERVKDYWAKDLPVNRGFSNFDTIKFDFYSNQTVALEAFLKGDYDFMEETDPARWAKVYRGPAIDHGKIKLVATHHQHQVGMRGFAFNTRRELFSDKRVREAITEVFDFEWVNKNLYHNALTRTTSFFDNTEFAAHGLPQKDTLDLLTSIKDQVPSSVFTEAYELPKATTQAEKRMHIHKAQQQLKEAGWILRHGKLVHEKTGKPFTFEILLNSPEYEKVALVLARNLKPLGIQASVQIVDNAQYERRRNESDFDMVVHFWGHSMSPGVEQGFYWSSKAADEPGTRNYPGLKVRGIDTLCERLTQAKTRHEQVTILQALDHLLLEGYYVLPFGHRTQDYFAYWTRIDHPTIDPKLGIPSWLTWWSKEIKVLAK